ncbi:MAG: hypothetical protein HRT68_03680 [Flavobacteriaceae bacterium]|nr:hypothetical protein [Flavobacteriaceae bacterium]
MSCQQAMKMDVEQAEAALEKNSDIFTVDTLVIDGKKEYYDGVGRGLDIDLDIPIEKDSIESDSVLHTLEPIKLNYGYDLTPNESGFVLQKLQEYYDLLLLEKNHPEFKKEADIQLNSLADFKALIDNDTDSISVAIKELKWVKSNSLNLHTHKIYYTRNQVQDSILVTIQRTHLLVNGEQVYDQKIRFSQLND